jgi:hypothetical protein
MCCYNLVEVELFRAKHTADSRGLFIYNNSSSTRMEINLYRDFYNNETSTRFGVKKNK